MIRIIPLAGALLASACWCTALASDPTANPFAQMQDVQDEIVELQAAQTTFRAIHRPRQGGKARGSIVLLHDGMTNADSLEVIRPLRLAMADAGWDTLSLQLPGGYRDEPPGAWLARREAIDARLQAGLDWLQSRAQTARVVIGLGESGSVAVRRAARQSTQIQALVVISYPIDSAAEKDDLEALRRLAMPTLDLYAERDTAAVQASAAMRRQVALDGQLTAYRQAVVAGATPGFGGLEEPLVSDVRAWLAANVPGASADRSP